MTRNMCSCGKPAVRATVFYRLKPKAKREEIVHQQVCEVCYKRYHLGLETFDCPTCGRSFFIDLEDFYDEDAWKTSEGPFCLKKNHEVGIIELKSEDCEGKRDKPCPQFLPEGEYYLSCPFCSRRVKPIPWKLIPDQNKSK